MKKLFLFTMLVTVMAAFGATAAQAGDKVDVCHFPPENPDNWHTITVSENAVDEHLAHGDLLAICEGCAMGYRFEDQGDGTVLDCNTQLVWLKDANCFGLRTWAGAEIAAANLQNGDCGLTDGSVAGDWRQPTRFEFCDQGGFGPTTCLASNAPTSLINRNFLNPALSDAQGTGTWSEGDPFVNVPPSGLRTWTGTESPCVPGPGALNCAYYMRIDNGFFGVNGKTGTNNLVWPVRSP